MAHKSWGVQITGSKIIIAYFSEKQNIPAKSSGWNKPNTLLLLGGGKLLSNLLCY